MADPLLDRQPSALRFRRDEIAAAHCRMLAELLRPEAGEEATVEIPLRLVFRTAQLVLEALDLPVGGAGLSEVAHEHAAVQDQPPAAELVARVLRGGELRGG